MTPARRNPSWRSSKAPGHVTQDSTGVSFEADEPLNHASREDGRSGYTLVAMEKSVRKM